MLTNSSGYKHIFAKTKRIIILLNRCLRKSIALYELNRNIAENILTEQKSNRDEYFGNFIYNTDFIYITKIFNYILENIYLADECVVMIYVLITDLYCLYRLLSKNYINHAIIYTGMWHTTNYVRTLVHDFDFVVTHIGYSKLPLDKTNKLLQSNNSYDMSELFFKPKLKQCIDIGKFPDKFL